MSCVATCSLAAIAFRLAQTYDSANCLHYGGKALASPAAYGPVVSLSLVSRETVKRLQDQRAWRLAAPPLPSHHKGPCCPQILR